MTPTFGCASATTATRAPLTIADNGVGMTHDELVENLGTIAHSGSKKFLEAAEGQSEGSDLSLIGQFGVGFYSAWLVADRVEVVSRAAGQAEAWRWSSNAQGRLHRRARRARDPRHLGDPPPPRGPEGLPRELAPAGADPEVLGFRGPPDRCSRRRPRPPRRARSRGPAFETDQPASALWQRSKSEITEEQYEEFYKHLTNDGDEPAGVDALQGRGQRRSSPGCSTCPKRPPFEMDTPGEKRRGVKLFVKRVFIMDNCDALVPLWLRFVRGVIDSDDLPLNVSRETLQDSAVVRGIKKQVARRPSTGSTSSRRTRPRTTRPSGALRPVLKEGPTSTTSTASASGSWCASRARTAKASPPSRSTSRA
jgi:molecular chaperone HtpG